MLLHQLHLALVLLLDQGNLSFLDLDTLSGLLHVGELLDTLGTVVLHHEDVLAELEVLGQEPNA